MTKYHNTKTEADGYIFDSRAEARRYQELCRLQQAKVITGLELQPRYDLAVNGVKLGFYRGDFRYVTAKGNVICEDVKGVKTPIYRLKKKLVKALHNVEIWETTA